MKLTKRAKKNLARQKLKLESERITKDETLETEVAVDSANCRNEIGVLIMAIIFSPFMLFLIYCSGDQFDDVYQRQIENRKAEHTETASKNVVDSLVDSFIGNEPLNETKAEDTANDTLKKHRVEAIKIDKNKQLSNEDYQKVLVSNIHYLEYINTVNKTREDLSNNKDKVDKEITHLTIAPAAGFETKDNIFIDILKYENDKQPSKDEIVENLEKESAFILASENTEEGKLSNAFSESENELNANEDERPSPIIALLKILFLFFLLYFVSFPSTVKSIFYKALSKYDLTSPPDMESGKNAKPKFVLKICDNDDEKYSNKL